MKRRGEERASSRPFPLTGAANRLAAEAELMQGIASSLRRIVDVFRR